MFTRILQRSELQLLKTRDSGETRDGTGASGSPCEPLQSACSLHVNPLIYFDYTPYVGLQVQECFTFFFVYFISSFFMVTLVYGLYTF